MKVAIVHDWLTGMRGGERVLEILCQMFPDAEIYTLFHHQGSVSPIIERHRIHTSFLQKAPRSLNYRYMLPLFPYAVEQFNLKGYDLVISSSHCAAMGAITGSYCCHICYSFTPARYLWEMQDEYFNSNGKRRITRAIIDYLSKHLRQWEVCASHRVDLFIAISEHIKRRINKYYRRDAVVLHPPVNHETFYNTGVAKEDFYLIVSAPAPYKRLDLAIEAFNRLGDQLVIIGDGPQMKKLRSASNGNIKFLGWQPDRVLNDYYNRARALIFPGIEDYGLTPLEANAVGTPVIALAAGGVLETIKENIGGIFFDHQDVDSLCEAVQRSKKISLDREAMIEHTKRFSIQYFMAEFKSLLQRTIANFGKKEKT